MCLNQKATRAPQSKAVLRKVDPNAHNPTLVGDIYFKLVLIAERMLGLGAINLQAYPAGIKLMHSW